LFLVDLTVVVLDLLSKRSELLLIDALVEAVQTLGCLQRLFGTPNDSFCTLYLYGVGAKI
jgi:hypothetical protein